MQTNELPEGTGFYQMQREIMEKSAQDAEHAAAFWTRQGNTLKAKENREDAETYRRTMFAIRPENREPHQRKLIRRIENTKQELARQTRENRQYIAGQTAKRLKALESQLDNFKKLLALIEEGP